MILLSQLVAIAYVVIGTCGLLVVSIPGNRQDMFLAGSPASLGRVRVAHAYATLLLLVACGLAVWFRPLVVAPLAWAVLGLVLIGKVPSVALGQWGSCKCCAVAGPALAFIATLALVAPRP